MSSPNTERNDVIQSKVIPDYLILSKQENAKYKLKYITSHPFATNWSFEQIVDFENKGQPISTNGRVYYPDSYKNTTTISQDNKSELQHKQGQQRAKQERLRQEENKQQDFLNDFTNETIGWVPGVNTFVRAGLSQWANRTNNPRAAEYDINAALGLVGDAAMFAFGGVKPLELATAYTGSKVGKHYGGTVGEIAGVMVGGKAGSNLQQAIQDIRILNNTRRFAKRLDEVVNSTPFYNLNVQHVSPNGMTIGSHLTPYNSTDVGIHVVTPNETKAVANILKASDVPTTVREGVLTYTQNTAPINYGNDLGLWGSNVNPELYSHFLWNYPFKLDNPRMQDAITLGENAPIGEYVNTWEGEGLKALIITDPSYLLLSKNLIVPSVRFERFFYPDTYLTKDGMYVKAGGMTELPELSELLANFQKRPDGNYEGVLPGHGSYRIEKVGDKFQIYKSKISRGLKSEVSPYVPFGGLLTRDDLVNFFKLVNKTYLESADDLQKLAYNDYNVALSSKEVDMDFPNRDALDKLIKHTTPEMKSKLEELTNNEILNFYNSEEYADRIRNILKTEFPSASDEAIEKTITNYISQINEHKHTPFVYKKDLNSRGWSAPSSISHGRGWNNEYGINLASIVNGGFGESTLMHELGHTLFNSTNMRSLNNLLFKKYGFPKDHLKVKLAPEASKYITDPDEFRQRLYQGSRLMINEGLTVPEVMVDPRFIDTSLPKVFDHDYLETILPLIAQNNDSYRKFREPNYT